jgi:hypothetical protein
VIYKDLKYSYLPHDNVFNDEPYTLWYSHKTVMELKKFLLLSDMVALILPQCNDIDVLVVMMVCTNLLPIM